MTSSNRISVMLVDDHAMVRRGLATILDAHDDMQLAGEAADGEASLLTYERCKPDVVLMDMMMPRMDGVEAIRKIRERHPDAKIIALTSFASEELVQRALQAGALGHLLKDATADDLIRAVRAAQQGKRTLAPEAADALIHLIKRGPQLGGDLTDRERQVLTLMVEGLNNTEIADRLVLSVSTIKFHVSAILSKLGVTNRIKAAVLAVEDGLVPKVEVTNCCSVITSSPINCSQSIHAATLRTSNCGLRTCEAVQRLATQD